MRNFWLVLEPAEGSRIILVFPSFPCLLRTCGYKRLPLPQLWRLQAQLIHLITPGLFTSRDRSGNTEEIFCTQGTDIILIGGAMAMTQFQKTKRKLRFLVEHSPIGYRAVTRLYDGIRGPFGQPKAPWHNAVLQTMKERDDAASQVETLGLPLAIELSKNWDSLAALDCILANTNPSARILDAGAELYSVILPSLYLYGYSSLNAINLEFAGVTKQKIKRGPMLYEHGDITKTRFDSGYFDAITCISVIEHGVDLTAYFCEMSRILKPGGVLITSTDYWDTHVDSEGKQFFGVPVRIFSGEEIEIALSNAHNFGLHLTGPLNLACTEKVVNWIGLDYTFVVYSLRKD